MSRMSEGLDALRRYPSARVRVFTRGVATSRRSHSQRKINEGALNFLSSNWRLLFGVGLFLLLVSAAVVTWYILVVGGSKGAFLAGLTVGSLTVAALSMVVGLWLIFGDGYNYLLGNEGEKSTREVLACAVQSGDICCWVDNIELDGMDIDHVVVAPRGVLVIETKFWKTVRTKDVNSWNSQAARNARKVGSIFRSTEIKSPQDTRPLVVVWGAAVGLEGASGDDFGKLVISGRALGHWLAERSSGEMPRQHGLELVQELEEFAAKHAEL